MMTIQKTISLKASEEAVPVMSRWATSPSTVVRKRLLDPTRNLKVCPPLRYIASSVRTAQSKGAIDLEDSETELDPDVAPTGFDY
jgi:hypothetical protein